MTYYLSFLLIAVAISEVIRLALKKEWIYLGKSVGAMAVVSILTLMSSASNLMTTFEYSKYTTRGTSDLTIKPKGQAAKMTAKEGLKYASCVPPKPLVNSDIEGDGAGLAGRNGA